MPRGTLTVRLKVERGRWRREVCPPGTRLGAVSGQREDGSRRTGRSAIAEAVTDDTSVTARWPVTMVSSEPRAG
nr:hypothetical protein GCM10020241_05050 [Streptoalloteichus tenebrarius]